MVHKYKSPKNGYTGKMYGEGTLEIYDPQGKPVYKTGRREVHTFTGLVQFVEDFPRFAKRMKEGK